MKIKTFKQQLKNEVFDIPNVLDKIKPLAYQKEYQINLNKGSFFKTLIQLVPVVTVFAICLLVLTKNFNNKPQVHEDPYDANYLAQNEIYNTYFKNLDPASECPSSPMQSFNSAKKDCTAGNYCMWVLENEGKDNFLIIDEIVFDYIINYMAENKNCTSIDIVKATKEKYAIPEKDAYTIRNAYDYIKNNYNAK